MEFTSILWFVLLVVFLVVEAACPIHLVSIWFAAGSFAAMVASFLHSPVWLQVTLFLTVSCLMVALLWPFIKKFLRPKLEKTNIDAVIGAEAVVTASIDNLNAVGQVKLNGMEWTARSSTGKPIPVGSVVKVEKVEGVKLFVAPEEVNAQIL